MSLLEARKVQILSQKESSASFTVNTGVGIESVDLIANGGVLINGDNKSIFPNGDGIGLLSIGYKLPLSFEFYRTSSNTDFLSLIEVNLIEDATNTIILPIDKIFLPFENYEMSLGVFYKDSAFTGRNYRLYASFPTTPRPQISMFGVDTKLNGKTFYCPIFIKLEHTLSLL
jgi:hypothetical protein